MLLFGLGFAEDKLLTFSNVQPFELKELIKLSNFEWIILSNFEWIILLINDWDNKRIQRNEVTRNMFKCKDFCISKSKVVISIHSERIWDPNYQMSEVIQDKNEI